jgi:hypothetical protein
MGRVVQTPLAAIGLLTRAPRSAAAIAHRLLSGLYACRRSVTSPVSRIKTGGGSGLPGKRDLLRDEVQKAPTSVMIICSTKIKVSGRLSGVLAWAYPELASARVGSCFSRSMRLTCGDRT